MRLFCFPFGGGGASVFHQWPDAVGDQIEVRALQLPGRETRYAESFEADVDYLIKNIVQALGTYQDKPYAMFGYSLGSLLAFETCRELRKQGLKMPDRLFLAALAPPQIPPVQPPIASLGDEEFVEKIEYYYQPGGEAWDDLELREFLLPVLKSDFALYESYVYRDEAPLNCPIDIFAGDSDRSIPLESMQYWAEHTSSEVKHHVFNGGHFFIDCALAEIQAVISSALNPGP